MPIKSQAQRAFLHIHHPKIAKRWERETPKGKLPKHVSDGAEPELAEFFGVNEGPGGKTDVSMDVELFIRLLEWAREEAQTDVQVHDVAEAVEVLSEEHGELSMEHYEAIMSAVKPPEGPEEP